MIVGLLNLYGPSHLQSLITTALTDSGLLAATDVLYYSHKSVPHPKSAHIKEEGNLFLCAKQYTDACIWSFNVKDFCKGKETDIDWCKYELYFLVWNWKRAVASLQAGYDGYGVNLFNIPRPHYDGYCFWMTGASLSHDTLQQPYCAYQSFVNHHTHRFPPEKYETVDWSQEAPFSSLEVRKGREERVKNKDLYTLLLLLYAKQLHFPPLPFMRSPRPFCVVDWNGDEGEDAYNSLLIPGTGTVIKGDSKSIPSSITVDLVVSVADRVEGWRPFLSGLGVLVIPDIYQGSLPWVKVGNYTIVAMEATSLG